MARTCAVLGVPMVQISTDYVFDGRSTDPLRPNDPTKPLGVYGQTKLAGEMAVKAAGCVHAILRTSWVFSAHGSNFVTNMLRISDTYNALRIVDDQVGGPTSASAIASACLTLIAGLQKTPSLSGIYHFSGAPDVSWKSFAETIFASSGRNVTITGIPTAEYPTPAARPLNSRLVCATTEAAFGLVRPDWRIDLKEVLCELGALSAEEIQL